MSELFDRNVLKDITDKSIHNFIKRCHPVMQNEKNGELAEIMNLTNDFRGKSYMWEAEAGFVIQPNPKEVGRVVCYWPYGYYGFWKPSLHEAVGQIFDVANKLEARYFLANPPDNYENGWLGAVWYNGDGTWEYISEGARTLEVYMKDERGNTLVQRSDVVLYR